MSMRKPPSAHLVALCIVMISFLPVTTFAETVYVKYRGPVDLAPFNCAWIARSSFIERLCYDSRERYIVVDLQGTYYHYCEVPAAIVDDWKNSDSMGRFYNANIKGRYDCRLLHMPSYER